ncbi:MAG: 4-aminobutyrate--2-oxoglutarate transaminase [Candidatus Dormibacteraceae bacterium]
MASAAKFASRGEELRELRERFLPRGITASHPIFAARALGSQLWDVDGNVYIDFAGGIGVLNVGHNHPRIIRAIEEQLESLTHSAFQVAMYEPYLRLAERLCGIAPGDGPKKAIFFSTGAEAVENAVKIARAHTGRPALISFSNSFHGRTLLGLSLTGTAAPYKQNFGPFAPEIYRAPYPYEYHGWTSELAIGALEDLFASEVSPDRVAAVIIEPVLGEGGFVPAPRPFLRELRRITEAHGILLIADEIQSGYGRTGRMFAIEHSGVVPDLMAVAKSIAAGLPLSGVVGRAEVMDAPDPGGLGGTYGGNPVACAAGLAVLQVMEEEGLVARAATLGSLLEERLGEWGRRHPIVGDVRVLGAMAGIELVRDRGSREPATGEAARVIDECRRHGLLALRAGQAHNVIRTLMPLSIPDAMLDEGLETLEAAIAAASRTLNAAAGRRLSRAVPATDRGGRPSDE